jgi:hypothetical protein
VSRWKDGKMDLWALKAILDEEVGKNIAKQKVK